MSPLSRLNKLSISRRLLASNLASVVLVTVVGAAGFLAVGDLDVAMDAISTNGAAIKDQMAADQVHDALRADVLAALLAGQSDDKAAREAARRDAAEHTAAFRSLIASMDKRVADPALRRAVDTVRPDIDAYLRAVGAITEQALADPAAARQALPGFMEHFHRLEKSMDALSTTIEGMSDSTRRAGDTTVVRARRHIELGTLLAALVTLGAGLLLARSISRPLGDAVGVADRIAAGRLDSDLACATDDHTETGRLQLALQGMQDSLRRIVGEVRTGTDAIATAAAQIAAGNQDLSSRTETQAGAVEETASSLEELTATVRQNADNARQANQLARSASEVAERGGAVVGEVVSTMEAIDASARRIGDIIGVIEGIAFQTNILALNAAVEAARAGEQGRGFAVVAGEVRTLAQRANAAAKEIKDLVDDSARQVGAGTRLVGEAGATMRDVVDSVRRVTDIMGEISAASREQEAGIGQVNGAVGEIDAATQQNAALVEQASAASEAMREQAEQLRRVVASFRLAPEAPARSLGQPRQYAMIAKQ